jgi:hypothetical protein
MMPTRLLAQAWRHFLVATLERTVTNVAKAMTMITLRSLCLPHLLEYATLDALLSLLLVENILPLLSSANDGVITAPENLDNGSLADLHVGGRHVAQVKIIFVGGNMESKDFRGVLVGKGKLSSN